MAEIKSALEIALERAAALGSGEDDSKREAQEKGQALARQSLGGDLAPTDMAEQLAGLPTASTGAAARALLEALEQGREGALPGLEAICPPGPAREACQGLTQAQARREQTRLEVEAELAKEMAGELAAKGIGGNAIRPNPLAHPEYEARRGAAMAGAEAELKAAGEKLVIAMGCG